MQDKDIQKALRNPSQTYPEPEAVLNDDALTLEQKKQVLQQWEQEAIRLQGSEDEGMTGGETSQLDRVKNALDSLNQQDA